MNITFSFFLVDHYSLFSISSALEPLRLINYRLGVEKYRWRFFSDYGGKINSSSGIGIETTSIEHTDALSDTDYFFVCASINFISYDSTLLKNLLHRLDTKKRVILGGISNGSYLLAKYGLLEDYKFTIHWESIETIRQKFPTLWVSNDIYVIDNLRASSSGGLSSMDLMLEIMKKYESAETLQNVVHNFIVEKFRKGSQTQYRLIDEDIVKKSFTLYRSIGLMRNSISQKLEIKTIADFVSISPRQLERLFKKHLAMSPMDFLLKLRLEQARNLLLFTKLPIIEIALSCGFQDASYFSRVFKSLEKMTPTAYRETHADS